MISYEIIDVGEGKFNLCQDRTYIDEDDDVS